MVIMKQLFDVSSIIDRINNLDIVSSTFHKLVPIELGYRGLDNPSAQDVLNDIYDTAMNICLYGALNKQEYNYLPDGAHRVNGFILIENYTMERAVRDAAKVAYLVLLIQLGINEVRHYNKGADATLANILIENQSINKLNRIKKNQHRGFLLLSPTGEIALASLLAPLSATGSASTTYGIRTSSRYMTTSNRIKIL